MTVVFNCLDDELTKSSLTSSARWVPFHLIRPLGTFSSGEGNRTFCLFGKENRTFCLFGKELYFDFIRRSNYYIAFIQGSVLNINFESDNITL